MILAALLFLENDKSFNCTLSKTLKVGFKVMFAVVLK